MPSIESNMSTASLSDGHRQHHVHSEVAHNGSASKNANPSGDSLVRSKARQMDTEAWTFTSLANIGEAVVQTAAPWTVMVGLIFGGCCSNVFTLEKIVKEEPDSGLLITFVQFIITALFTWPTHFSISSPPFFVKPRAIPLTRWIPNIVMFFLVNILNNYAFGYNISVPVHIILRSGGSIMTMAVGFIWGKRYTKVQVFSVAMLTSGIIMAAMGDAQAKGRTDSDSLTKFDSDLISGLAILFIAQLLSAIMGLFTQLTYAKHGSHWQENLFYSHAISIPLFAPLFPSLLTQFRKLLSSPPILLSPQFAQAFQLSSDSSITTETKPIPPIIPAPMAFDIIPKHIATLLLNALTQYACIRGVNLLGARTSALGVSIVLNLRKLISLFLSIWLFGNQLPTGVCIGAAVVFGSAGVWAWESQRVGRRSREKHRKRE